MRNNDCNTCGGFGYTVDIDHTMTGCFECYVASHEAEYTVSLDDGEDVCLPATSIEAAMQEARERGYRPCSAEVAA